MISNFLQNNWISVLIVLISLLDKLRELTYGLMLAVEKAFGQGDGQKKFEIVFGKVYSLLPAWLRLFVQPNDLREKLQEWYILAKDYLDDGEINKST